MSLHLLLLISIAINSIDIVHNVVGAQDTQCTYTVAGWSNRSGTALMTSLANDSLCGVPWGPLVRKRPVQLIVADTAPWLLATQTYIAASLNWRRLSSREPLALWSSDQYGNLTIDRALALLGDSLARACDEMRQWSFADGNTKATVIMLLLDDFNHGLLDEAPACDDEFDMMAISMALDTLYYVNGNDVVVSRDPVTNLTRVTSLIEGLYATHYGLYALCSFLIVLVLLLGLKLVLVLHQSHVYRITRRDDTDIPFAEYDIDTGSDPLSAAGDTNTLASSTTSPQLNIQERDDDASNKSHIDIEL